MHFDCIKLSNLKLKLFLFNFFLSKFKTVHALIKKPNRTYSSIVNKVEHLLYSYQTITVLVARAIEYRNTDKNSPFILAS